MEEVVLDTDALIEFQRKRNRKLLEKALSKYRLVISVITMYEYLFGVKYIGKDPSRVKSALERVYVVVPLTQEILMKMLEIDTELSKIGQKLPFNDITIGATAIVRGATLVTGNVRHFERMRKFGLKFELLDEFMRKLTE